MSRLLKRKLSRRRFLGVSSCALGTVALGSQLNVLKALAEPGSGVKLSLVPDRSVFTCCEMCVN
ncbi:MAG TPA: twin-arginine translocation signal domain-containing protein, partial [Tichowtungia sp.]|nr:twin-arginine translocation signal domain-containing protein [Tichowtungia sp.]